MKRLLCLLTVSFLFALTACGENKNPFSKSVPPMMPAYFSSDMRIIKDGGEMTANIVRDRNGVTKITVVTPEDLGGLSLRFGNDTGSLSYGNMSIDIDCSKFPETMIFKILLDTLKRLTSDADITARKTSSGWEYALTDGTDKKITVIQNLETGFIDSVNVPSRSFLIEFSNFEELTETTIK
ncbi:MAG: hypothetical protein GX107_05750 [Clostridiales bacterium]|jgi:hypothetical protein|nr:hypothetical protein [Clostridiales bacterium]